MNHFVKRVAELAREKTISIDEATRIIKDYWNLRDEVTGINKKLEESDKNLDRGKSKELVKTLGQKHEELQQLERKVFEEPLSILERP